MESKKEYLEPLMAKVRELRCNDREIDQLLQIFDDEYARAHRELTLPNRYLEQLNETKTKQIESLIRVKNRPKLRVDAFKSAQSDFIIDIMGALIELKLSPTRGN